MEILYALVIIIALIAGIANAINRPSGSKFSSLGELRGKTLAEVIGAVGLPTSYSTSKPQTILVQWITTGFHIALLFEYRGQNPDWGDIDNHRAEYICLGVTHQYGL